MDRCCGTVSYGDDASKSRDGDSKVTSVSTEGNPAHLLLFNRVSVISRILLVGPTNGRFMARGNVMMWNLIPVRATGLAIAINEIDSC